MAGTAPHARRWLLLEADGAWGRDAVRDSVLPPAVIERLVEWEEGETPGRVLLIRQPGRRRPRGSTLILADVREDGTTLRQEALDGFDDILDVDLDAGSVRAPVDQPLLLVCVHGRRDACCSRLGVPVHRALVERLGADAVWQCTHFGGHRFAANVLALPLGMMLGRVRPTDAPSIVDMLLAGRMPLEHARGRVSHSPEVQAAELALRDHLGERSPAEIAFLGSTEGVHRFATQAGDLSVSVERKEGPALPVSCGGEPESGLRLIARIVPDAGGPSATQPVGVIGDPDERRRQRG